MVNLTTVTDALKNLYIGPMREDINLKADAFASRVMQTSDHISGYKKIIRAAQIGANGGAGAGTETGALPSAGENPYVQMESDTKNLFGVLSISDKILKSNTGSDAGAFINTFQREIDTLMKTLKWNVARQFYGDGSGVLCTLKVLGTAGKVVEIQTTSSTQYLLPGLKVDQMTGSTVTKAGLRITDVDHKTGKITVDQNVTVTAGDALVIQGSYGLELTGLGKIFETISGASQTIYGLNRSTYSWLRPYLNASFGTISEKKLDEVINLLEDTYNITINHINCGNTAYGFYLDLMNQRRAINDVMILEGGHKALKFNGIPLTRNKFMPAATIDLYDTKLFTLDQISDWEWIEGESRQILHQNAGYPTYNATITKYCDLMCALPGGLARLSAVTAPST